MNNVRNFGFLLKDVSRKYSLRFEQHAREISLKHSNSKALAYLERNEGVSQCKLAELTDIDPMTMVRILDHMEAEGLVERMPDPADRRARRLYLTPKSKPVLDEIWNIADQIVSRMFADVSESEQKIFLDVLGRINHNLSLPAEPAHKAQSNVQDSAPSPKADRGKHRVTRTSSR